MKEKRTTADRNQIHALKGIITIIKHNYKIIGLIALLPGAAYTARAFGLARTGELFTTNTYPLVIGILLCVSALGICICGTGRKSFQFNLNRMELFAALLCFIVFTLTFEKIGAIKASFIFSFILGAVWNRNSASGEAAQKFSFIAYLKANKFNITENIIASCVSAAGVWLVFERLFSLSLP